MNDLFSPIFCFVLYLGLKKKMKEKTNVRNRDIDVILKVTSDFVGATHTQNFPTQLDMFCHYMHKLNHRHCAFS